MGDFIGILADGVRHGNLWLVVVLFVVLFVLNAPKLYSLLVEYKTHRLKGVEAALRSEWVQGQERECLKELAATEHFYAATGIMMEKAPRRALLEIYARSDGRLPFVHFKRAASHVRYDNGVLEVRLGRFEWLMMSVGLLVGVVLLFVSTTLLVWTLYLQLALGSEPLGSWKTWLLYSLVGLLALMSSRSAYSANRVGEEIKRQARDNAASGNRAGDPSSAGH